MTSYFSQVVGLAYEGRGEYIVHNVGPGSVLALRAEPSNQYDPHAVAVFHGRQKIGYLPGRSQWIAQSIATSGVQEIIAGDLDYDEFGVPVALQIEVLVPDDREPMRIAPGQNPRGAMPELSAQPSGDSGATELAVSPVMLRARPIAFFIAILLIPVLVGILLLFYWWLDARTTRLEINRNSVKYETGIFSKDRRELGRGKIRTVRVQQSLLNRMLNVGSLEIYTAGDKPEIVARDMFNPNDLRRILGIQDSIRKR